MKSSTSILMVRYVKRITTKIAIITHRTLLLTLILIHLAMVESQLLTLVWVFVGIKTSTIIRTNHPDYFRMKHYQSKSNNPQFFQSVLDSLERALTIIILIPVLNNFITSMLRHQVVTKRELNHQ